MATANDAFANAIEVIIPPDGESPYVTEELNLQTNGIEPGEPHLATYEHTAWWKYTPATSGILNVNPMLGESHPATGAAIYTGGPTLGTLIGPWVVGLGASYMFDVTASTTYYIQGYAAYTEFTGAPGTFKMSMYGPPSLVPPPTGTLLSTVVDACDSVDTDKWATTGTVTAANGYLTLGGPGGTGAITTTEVYDLDRVYWRATVPTGATMVASLAEYPEHGSDRAEILVIRDGGNNMIRASWSIGASAGSGGSTTYRPDRHGWLRIQRVPGPPTLELAFQTSANGTTWTTLHSVTIADATDLRYGAFAIAGSEGIQVDNVNTHGGGGGGGGDDDGTPEVIPDPFDPGAISPPSGSIPEPGESLPDPTCKTVLELIREFSSAVYRPVRITGPSTIEMVNVNTPLPAGWTVAEAGEVYTSTQYESAAGEGTVSWDALSVNVSAELVADDVRLLTSDWQIPHQLPVFGFGTALVKRITYTFSPHGFRGAVDFRPVPIPASMRRQDP